MPARAGQCLPALPCRRPSPRRGPAFRRVRFAGSRQLRGKIRGNLFRGGSDQKRGARALAQGFAQNRIRTSLIFAAQDDDQRARESFDGLQGRVHVGGFRIVVKLDAAYIRHEFQAVLDSPEALDALLDGGGRRAGNIRSGAMPPEHSRHYADHEAEFRPAAPARISDPSARKTISPSRRKAPSVTRFSAAEPDDARARRARCDHFRIIRIENSDVALCLVFKQAHLCARILLKRAVAVQMIRREVQKNADVRAELRDCFQLKAADFGNRDAGVGRRFDQRKKRNANIAAHQRDDARCFENVRDQRGRGGLAVRSRNSDQFPAQEPPGKLDFAPDRNSACAREKQVRADLPEHRG